jgi:release factor glutamine methyltransferase
MRLFTVEELVRICAGVAAGADAENEAREIIAAVLNVTRSWPTVHPHAIVGEEATAEALFASRMRAQGMPLQYAVGKAPFRHLMLAVDKRVLIPRPETEVLVDLVLKAVPTGSIADIGTGSGAIAVSLATEGAYERVVATDVSRDALEVARDNAGRYETELRGPIDFREGSLVIPLGADLFDAIVSNPPYIAEDEMDSLPPEVRDWEPHLALVSGKDGLDAVREITRASHRNLKPGGLLALEVDTRRAERAADILKADGNYEKIEITADLTGRPRFVSGRRR